MYIDRLFDGSRKTVLAYRETLVWRYDTLQFLKKHLLTQSPCAGFSQGGIMNREITKQLSAVAFSAAIDHVSVWQDSA